MFFQAEGAIRGLYVTGVQTCALPISTRPVGPRPVGSRPALGRRRAGAGRRGLRRLRRLPEMPCRALRTLAKDRSEERRVGEEWRYRVAPAYDNIRMTVARRTTRQKRK